MTPCAVWPILPGGTNLCLSYLSHPLTWMYASHSMQWTRKGINKAHYVSSSLQHGGMQVRMYRRGTCLQRPMNALVHGLWWYVLGQWRLGVLGVLEAQLGVCTPL